MMDHPTRRGNYDSGQDYVLEYGDLRFTFNERDFSERVEQAALKLGFVGGRLESTELEDLVNLTVNGEVQDPASGLGEHVNDCWPELVGPAERSLVHWLRRLVFRSAWLDQRVKEGELDVVFDEAIALVRLRPARARPRADRALARAQLGPGRVHAPVKPRNSAKRLSRRSSVRASSRPPPTRESRRARKAGLDAGGCVTARSDIAVGLRGARARAGGRTAEARGGSATDAAGDTGSRSATSPRPSCATTRAARRAAR